MGAVSALFDAGVAVAPGAFETVVCAVPVAVVGVCGADLAESAFLEVCCVVFRDVSAWCEDVWWFGTLRPAFLRSAAVPSIPRSLAKAKPVITALLIAVTTTADVEGPCVTARAVVV